MPLILKPTSTPQQVILPTPVPERTILQEFPRVFPTPIILSAPNQRYTFLRNIRFNFQTNSFPNQVPIYRVEAYGLSEPDATTIAKSLSFNTKPIVETTNNKTTLVWKSDDSAQNLLVSLENGYIEYSSLYTREKPNNAGDHITTIKSKDEVVSIANNFLGSRNLYSGALSSSPSKVTFYKGGLEPERTDDFSSAKSYLAEFSRLIDEKTIYTQNANTSYASVWIDNFGAVKKLIIQNLVFYKNEKLVSILTIDEAKSKLNQGEGVLVSFGPREIGVFPSTTLQSVSLTSMSLGYFDDRRSKLIVPIFVFEGTAIDVKGLEHPIVVYLSSLRNQK